MLPRLRPPRTLSVSAGAGGTAARLRGRGPRRSRRTGHSPIAQIIGTNTAGGRRRLPRISCRFWILGRSLQRVAICEAHLGDTGITDPIRCFEYMGCFYVQEGNKRVSVLKTFDAPTIRARMSRASCRFIPMIRLCGSIMNFCTFTGSAACIRCISTTSATYPKLQARWALTPTTSGRREKVRF